MSMLLTLEAWTEFAYTDLLMTRGFRSVWRVIGRTRVRAVSPAPATIPAVVSAVQTACILYVKPAYCLQRSVVLTRLLRRRGVAADLVIGCRMPPLAAHAWVEVGGEVINDDRPDHVFLKAIDRW
jgi:hypothetical protein